MRPRKNMPFAQKIPTNLPRFFVLRFVPIGVAVPMRTPNVKELDALQKFRPAPHKAEPALLLVKA